MGLLVNPEGIDNVNDQQGNNATSDRSRISFIENHVGKAMTMPWMMPIDQRNTKHNGSVRGHRC